jgi:predicted transposase YdaD
MAARSGERIRKAEDTMTVLDQYKLEGKIEGKEEERYEMALRFLENSVDIQIVAKCTGYSLQEIRDMQQA